jgi:Glycosyl transferase family 2
LVRHSVTGTPALLQREQTMRISVALCTFNGERFLLDQLRSIQAQSRLPDELVICDDMSQDRTAAIVEQFALAAGFPVRFSSNANRLGVAANYARAISFCAGDLIVLCDQDDLWDADNLAVLEDCFVRDPKLSLCFSNPAILTHEGKPTGTSHWEELAFNKRLQAKVNGRKAFETLLRFNVVTGAATAFRASLRDAALPIPEGFVHDEWIGLIAAATGKVRGIDRPLIRYRRHSGQTIGPATRRLTAQFRQARAKMGRPYFVRMVSRTRSLHERLAVHRDLLARRKHLSMVAEKLAHANARLRMRDKTLIRWPLVIGEAVRGRYRRFGYGIKSLLQDLVLE